MPRKCPVLLSSMGVGGEAQAAEISWDAASEAEKARKAQSVIVLQHTAFHQFYDGKDTLSVEQFT